MQQVIAQAEARMIRRIEVTPDEIMADLEDYKELGVRTEQVGAAIRATELQGKQIGMFVDRSVNVNVDLNGSHLETLAEMLSGPRQASGDDDDD